MRPIVVERVTDREREAVRERWAELERRRAVADRLVAGIVLLGVGTLLVLPSVPGEACVHGGGVAGAACTAVGGPVIVGRIRRSSVVFGAG
ncbi:hypothetical protein BRC93_12515 [Halobacteriales archaeon QS_5_70_15]|nr:MAG: hypothetical protein BRC93_12515 [Halobacteriales archaeon QS_5_70_15]